MIKSMTGFGRHRAAENGYDVLCEVKSVNSRYLDTTVKTGRSYVALEERIKQFAANRFSRGKLDIYVGIDKTAGENAGITPDEAFIDRYVKQLRDVKKRWKLSGRVSVSDIAARGESFCFKHEDEDMELVWASVLPVLEKAFDSFAAMREREGEKLAEDLLGHLSALEAMRESIARRAPAAVAENNEKMKARIKELLEGADYDESRLLTECAVFADKADISEELARLGSHFSQFRIIIGENAPVGRKLDFLVQEMNREVNTIGSKANDGEIAKLVIEAKSTVEKIREQIQNVE
ncbi:MAG: YicC family protein [Clostridia bacterium]|nr:YicC family protein [Clostridia bacterium]